MSGMSGMRAARTTGRAHAPAGHTGTYSQPHHGGPQSSSRPEWSEQNTTVPSRARRHRKTGPRTPHARPADHKKHTERSLCFSRVTPHSPGQPRHTPSDSTPRQPGQPPGGHGFPGPGGSAISRSLTLAAGPAHGATGAQARAAAALGAAASRRPTSTRAQPQRARSPRRNRGRPAAAARRHASASARSSAARTWPRAMRFSGCIRLRPFIPRREETRACGCAPGRCRRHPHQRPGRGSSTCIPSTNSPSQFRRQPQRRTDHASDRDSIPPATPDG